MSLELFDYSDRDSEAHFANNLIGASERVGKTFDSDRDSEAHFANHLRSGLSSGFAKHLILSCTCPDQLLIKRKEF